MPKFLKHRESEVRPIPLWALSVPSAICIAAWSLQANATYSTGTLTALITACALIGGSFFSVLTVVPLIKRVFNHKIARNWPTFLALGISALALLPAALVTVVLLFR